MKRGWRVKIGRGGRGRNRGGWRRVGEGARELGGRVHLNSLVVLPVL